MEDSQISGIWTHSELRHHIKVLELEAVMQARIITGSQYCMARHISGCLNVIADRLSQSNQPITTQWSLHPEIVNQIFGMWGSPAVDMLRATCPQHASSTVYIPNSGASSTGDRCSVTRLAGKDDIHVSTVSPAQQSHSEAQDHPGGRSDSNSPLVAITTVFSTPTMPVCGPPWIFSVPPRPTVTTGICLGRQVIPSACMEALMQHYQAAGFSKEVSRFAAAPRRPSTNKMYDDWRLRFTSLIGPQDKEFIRFGPTDTEIATFPHYLFDSHGLSPQTIKGHRSCVASVLSHTGKAAAFQAKTISDMITSMELQRPRLTLVLPQ